MDMEEVFLRSSLMGGLSGIDWTALLALIFVSAFYFLAPALGYSANHRGVILASMWVLVGKLALTVLKLGVLFFEIVDGKTSGGPVGGMSPYGPGLSWSSGLFMLFFLIEAALFLLAMVLFVSGVASLRRTDAPRPLQRISYGDE
jgi:hypothetical protein